MTHMSTGLGSSSDIANQSNLDLLPLRMLIDCIKTLTFGIKAIDNKWCIAHKNGLNHEQETYLPMFL